jgi:hypothetical protein
MIDQLRPSYGDGDQTTRSQSQLDQRSDERDAKHASVPLRRVRAGEFVVRSFSTNSRPALRAAASGGRPRAGNATTGNWGTGQTLSIPGRAGIVPLTTTETTPETTQ